MQKISQTKSLFGFDKLVIKLYNVLYAKEKLWKKKNLLN